MLNEKAMENFAKSLGVPYPLHHMYFTALESYESAKTEHPVSDEEKEKWRPFIQEEIRKANTGQPVGYSDVVIRNLLHQLNLDRPDIRELPEGATIDCNITTLRKVADFLKLLPKRESSDQLAVMNTALGVILNYRDILPKHLSQWAESKIDPSEIEDALDLNKCPKCGGAADNGHDRCLPPSPYFCTKCTKLESKDDTRK